MQSANQAAPSFSPLCSWLTAGEGAVLHESAVSHPPGAGGRHASLIFSCWFNLAQLGISESLSPGTKSQRYCALKSRGPLRSVRIWSPACSSEPERAREGQLLCALAPGTIAHAERDMQVRDALPGEVLLGLAAM